MSDKVEKNKQWLLDYLSDKQCVDCGLSDIRCLTFDHLPKYKKTTTVSTLVHKGYSIDRIQEEIAKTVVRCLNCHQRVTDERSKSRRQLYWERRNKEMRK